MTTIYCDNVECKFCICSPNSSISGVCSAVQIELEIDKCGWASCKGEYENK
jgi:hypothetical protein